MPVTVNTLQNENENLKEQLFALTKDFENLQQMLRQAKVSTTNNGRQRSSTDAETQNNPWNFTAYLAMSSAQSLSTGRYWST